MSADAALLFFGFLWGLLGGKGSAASSSPPPPPRPEPWPEQAPGLPAGTRPPPPPWPAVVPAGLPPFPGAGWEPDEPPPIVVQQRAAQLRAQLWQRGRGAFRIEQTAGRWIAYKADLTVGNKQGVIAFREKRKALPAPSSSSRPSSSTAAVDPKGRPTLRRGATGPHVTWVQRVLGIPQTGTYDDRTFAAVDKFQRVNALEVDGVVGPRTWAKLDQHPRARGGPLPASPASPAPIPDRVLVTVGPATIHPGSPASLVELPTLRHGMGAKPNPPNEDVRLMQQRLGIPADGRFWNDTLRALKAYQGKHGLLQDGVCGPKTWAKLLAVRA